MSTRWTPTLRALAGALRSNPDDTEQWSVFGDCLTEAGDVRGRLVALSLRLADGALSAEQRSALQAEIAAIEAAHMEAWLSGLVLPRRSRPTWRCGFLVGLRLRRRRRFDDALFDALARLFAHPVGSMIGTLDLHHNRIGDDEAKAIAASAALSDLTSFDLSYNHINKEGAAAIAASTTLLNLATLHLGNNRIDANGAATIAASTTLLNLTALDLSHNHMGEWRTTTRLHHQRQLERPIARA